MKIRYQKTVFACKYCGYENEKSQKAVGYHIEDEHPELYIMHYLANLEELAGDKVMTVVVRDELGRVITHWGEEREE